jgi:hypothetical protein
MTTEANDLSQAGVADIKAARRRVNEYLQQQAERSRFVGCGLPDWEDRPDDHTLVIVAEQEYDFGWVFKWNSKKYVETGDVLEAILDNEPLIVDRSDGHIYTTWEIGRDHSWEDYLEGYRSGVRRHRED